MIFVIYKIPIVLIIKITHLKGQWPPPTAHQDKRCSWTKQVCILVENTHCQQLCGFSGGEDGKGSLPEAATGLVRGFTEGLLWIECSQKAKAVYDHGSLLIISRVDCGEAENLKGKNQLRLQWLREELAGIVWAAQWPCLSLDYIVNWSFCLLFLFLVISQWPWLALVFCEIMPNRGCRAVSTRPTSENTQG